jgi:alpha-L-rhamnosidase
VRAPWDLKVEHLSDRVLGLGERLPRLSWKLPDGAAGQVAFEVEIDGRPYGRVDGDAQVLVPWPGEPLVSRQQVEWRVRVWTEHGQTPWSATAWFETGLLEADDWTARWIEPVEDGRSAHALRCIFRLDEPARVGRLYATSHGIYECLLNGRRVGDVELAPGFSSYPRRLQVQAYDVTDLLLTGDNIWTVVLTDGWFRGRTGSRRQVNGYGSTLAFLGQLEVDGITIVTQRGWDSATGGPLVSADLMSGQVEDLRRRWADWRPVLVPDRELGPLTWSPAPPVRRVELVRPLSVSRLSPERQLVDLGQNINGWLRLSDLGPEGTEVTLVHGEALDSSGDVTDDNLRLSDLGGDVPTGPFQLDRVVSAGRESGAFEPRHTTHGFRYARVDGHPGRLTPDEVTGVVVHTDLRRTGWFRCSSDAINRLHDIAEWSFRDNACEIPTDCPQRERSGWTGDWQLFVPCAAFLYDVAGFSLKWLRDLAADQRDDGCILNYAPDPLRWQAHVTGYWPVLQGSSGWGDAVVIVPWELWRAYGDTGVLAELWPSMVRWLDFAAGMARTHRHPSREAARPQPLAHETFLWDGGFHWGEWHEPGADDLVATLSADQGSVGTAFLHRSAALAARIGDLLGHEADAARFRALAANALQAWRAEYIGPDGGLTPNTQATHVRALAFDLVPAELRVQTADRLVELVRNAGTHLGTGFLATPFLLPVLADTGHLDVAYELLLQRTPPSWLTMVERGATTVWEAWEGIDASGRAHDSLNHYSKGAVISFLHRYVAGIQMVDGSPGYGRFRVAPEPGGGLRWAQAVHDAPSGRIGSSWRLDHDRFVLTVTVPAGTEAEVVVPGQTGSLLQGPGTRSYATHRAAGCNGS